METAKTISVLHLEDEAPIIKLVRLRLKNAGLQTNITAAANKSEFLQKYSNHSYDVILLDDLLPDFDGISA